MRIHKYAHLHNFRPSVTVYYQLAGRKLTHILHQGLTYTGLQTSGHCVSRVVKLYSRYRTQVPGALYGLQNYICWFLRRARSDPPVPRTLLGKHAPPPSLFLGTTQIRKHTPPPSFFLSPHHQVAPQAHVQHYVLPLQYCGYRQQWLASCASSKIP